MPRWSIATVTALAALALGACSVPEKHLTDAEAPFACLNKPPPSIADDQITFAGMIRDSYSGDKIAGASVQAFLAIDRMHPIFTTTTDGQGEFSQRQGTGGAPLDAFLRATLNGYVTTEFYPAVRFSHSSATQLQQLMPSEITTLAGVAGLTVDLQTKALFLVTVTDCAGLPLGGATVSTTPPGDVRYFVNRLPSGTAVATDSDTGTALVANVPLSNTTINATVSGMTLRSHTIDSTAGIVIQTEIQP